MDLSILTKKSIIKFKHNGSLFEIYSTRDFDCHYKNARSIWMSIKNSSLNINGFNPKYTSHQFENNRKEGILVSNKLAKGYINWLKNKGPKYITITPYNDFPARKSRLFNTLTYKGGYYLIDVEYGEHVLNACNNLIQNIKLIYGKNSEENADAINKYRKWLKESLGKEVL